MVANLCTTGYPLYPCAVRGRKIGSPRLHSKLHSSLLELHSKAKWKEGKERRKGCQRERRGRRGEGEQKGKGRKKERKEMKEKGEERRRGNEEEGWGRKEEKKKRGKRSV